MAKKSEETISLARSDFVRTRQSQNFATSNGNNEGSDDTQRLSKIHDAEVSKYINNEKAARYKRIIWEIMNRDYLQGNNQKRVNAKKKSDSTKKVAKPPHGVENGKKLSSKVNYDILHKLNHVDVVDQIGDNEDMDSLGFKLQPKNEQSKSGLHSSGDDIDNEYAHENTASEESDDIKDRYNMSDPEIDDEYAGYDE